MGTIPVFKIKLNKSTANLMTLWGEFLRYSFFIKSIPDDLLLFNALIFL